jgi:hypothetical protein
VTFIDKKKFVFKREATVLLGGDKRNVSVDGIRNSKKNWNTSRVWLRTFLKQMIPLQDGKRVLYKSYPHSMQRKTVNVSKL